MNTKNKIDTKKTVGIAIFSALAVVVALVCNIIPPIAGFLSLDAKDAVIAIASFIYGPISAVIISFMAAFIELITFSTTGWYGFLMNFASSAAFGFVVSLIYRKHRNINGALFAFASAVFVTTCLMLLLNIFVTPLYMKYIGVPMTSFDVILMIPKILLPFNFAKSLLNSAIAMLLYKPVAMGLRQAKLTAGSSSPFKINRNFVIIIVSGFAALAIAVLILLFI